MSDLSKAQLDTCKSLLQQLELEMEQSLKFNQDTSAVVTLDQSRVGRLSRMDAMQQQAMAKAELQQLEQRLRLVKTALQKFDRDEYSWCEDCDEGIAFERLSIKPESQFCLQCQSKREKA